MTHNHHAPNDDAIEATLAAVTVEETANISQTTPAPALKQNKLFADVSPKYQQGGFEKEANIQTTQGFILGILAQGLDINNNQAINKATLLLNEDNPLSGTGLALFTTMLVALEAQLRDRQVELFIPNAKEAPTKERLQSLGDIAYGFTLGVFANGDIINNAELVKEFNDPKTPRGRELREIMSLLSDISTLDPDSEFSENDFNTVVMATLEGIYDAYDIYRAVGACHIQKLA